MSLATSSDVSRYSGGVALQASRSSHRVTVSVPRQDAPVGLRSYRGFLCAGLVQSVVWFRSQFGALSLYSSLGRYVVRRLRSSCTSSRRAARRSTSFQLSHFRCSTATPCVGLTHSYGYMLRSSSPGRARGSETCLPRSFRKVFRYGVPGKGGIKKASAKLLSCSACRQAGTFVW